MKYTFYLFMMCFFLFSCGQIQKEGRQFIKGETISFPVNDMASSNPAMSDLYESDTGEHLFLYNHIIKKLQISEFPSNKLKLNIPLEFENEKRARKFTGGTMISRDSIFVTFYPPGIGIMDFKGDLLVDDKVGKESYNVSHIGNGSGIPMFLVEGRVYGAQPFLMDHHRMKKEDIQRQHLVYSYDLASKEFQWHDVFYSSNYWEEGKKLSNYSWAMREDKIYIAPYYDHEIQVFDPRTNAVVEKKEVKSHYVGKFKYVNELPGSPEEAVIGTLQSNQYENFLYDKYRDVFYRIFFPPFEIDQEYGIEELRQMERSRPLVGIMLLDKDLNLLSEHVFDKFEVHPQFLVGKKGLYVSTNNVNRDDFSDDNSSYQLMVLE